MRKNQRISEYLYQKKRLIDQSLNKFLPPPSTYPSSIHRAMRYSLFSGGKRLRPILTIAAGETGNGNMYALIPAACAIELIHTFSLIHDDLPPLDNDDFRRGRPSCHRKFGEDVAILAGDALLTLGFELLGESERRGKNFLEPGTLIKESARAIGTRGMIGGQVVDLESQRKKIDSRKLEYIHLHKTASLIVASLRIGGIVGESSREELIALTNFGKAMGVCFQIVDDILDEKEPLHGSSYVSIFGRKRTMARIKKLTLDAQKSLKRLGERGAILNAINKIMVSRAE